MPGDACKCSPPPIPCTSQQHPRRAPGGGCGCYKQTLPQQSRCQGHFFPCFSFCLQLLKPLLCSREDSLGFSPRPPVPAPAAGGGDGDPISELRQRQRPPTKQCCPCQLPPCLLSSWLHGPKSSCVSKDQSPGGTGKQGGQRPRRLGTRTLAQLLSAPVHAAPDTPAPELPEQPTTSLAML